MLPLNACLRIVAILCLLSAAGFAHAAEPDPAEQWEAEIQKFEADETENPPEPGGVLFVGSSSIRMWDLAAAFPDLKPLNRGFGGSQYSDVVYYAERIVVKHKPRAIVLYSGDNDIASGTSAEQVVANVAKLLAIVEKQIPETHVIVLPIKPSIARWNFWPTMSDANAGLKKLTESRKTWHYADTATPMLAEDGQPRKDLFLDDGLHLNAEGYALWTRIVAEQLGSLAPSPSGRGPG